MVVVSPLYYLFGCILLANIELWHYIFPLLKFTFISLVLISFYKLFVKPGLLKKNRSSSEEKYTESGNIAPIKIELLRDKFSNPSLVNLIVRNIGNREVELEAPVLIFKRWFRKRRFRIKSVDFSDIYPMLIKSGSCSVVHIDLKQFYGFAPELIKTDRLGAEMKEVDGHTFRSGTICLKWF